MKCITRTETYSVVICLAKNTLKAPAISKSKRAFISGAVFSGASEGAQTPSITNSPTKGIGITLETQRSFCLQGSRFGLGAKAAFVMALLDMAVKSFANERNVSPRSLCIKSTMLVLATNQKQKKTSHNADKTTKTLEDCTSKIESCDCNVTCKTWKVSKSRSA